VTIETSLGTITVELDLGAAPITASNFLGYDDAGAYDGGRFYRTVTMDNQPHNTIKIEVIEGDVSEAYPRDKMRSIPLERTCVTGLRHVDGAISMGRDGPDTAIADFFICIGDQPELDFGGLRNPDGQGFAAFGRVIDGMEVVRAIQQSPHEEQRLVPVVPIHRISRV
jgi:peptidyl-prolyl cis-trans isomerase A (cyclophilin A)